MDLSDIQGRYPVQPQIRILLSVLGFFVPYLLLVYLGMSELTPFAGIVVVVIWLVTKNEKAESQASSIEEEIVKAKRHEKLLEFDEAANIYKELGMDDDTIRIRKLKAEQGAVKVTQKVVHGDEVTKTEIKDSVVSKSNIGSGGDDKVAKLEKIANLKKEGLIDDDEFKQMKKEILGK
jgi:hypothetical protein